MNQSTNLTSSEIFSWNRQRTNAELTSFIDRKLAQLTDVSLVD